MNSRGILIGLVLLTAATAPGCQSARVEPVPASNGARLTHGVAAEVSDTGAVIWGRCDRPAELHAELRAAGENPRTVSDVTAVAHDGTAKIVVRDLTPDTVYQYRVWCGDVPGEAAPASLRTAPRPQTSRPVRLVWSGDIGGQNVCRDETQGYLIFDQIRGRAPDLFIALGDMIYADDPCKPIGRYGNAQLPGPTAPATTLAEFWAIWQYHRADAPQQRLLASTPVLAVWDDHESLNDAGPHHDTLRSAPDHHLLPLGLAAFLDYQPIVPPPDQPTRLYRSVRWGRQLEVFLLDTRQYRDSNARVDDPLHPKSMLGAAQRQWLIDGLARSDATWQIVISSVPMSIPTGFPPEAGRDGWAGFDQPTGFANELGDILRELQGARLRNLIWLTTDVHFATGFRYHPLAEAPNFVVYEFTSGPLNAGVFPIRDFDTQFGAERLFLHAPASADAIANFEEAKHWFNFGMIEIDEAGQLRVQIITANGETVYDARLAPSPPLR